MKVASLFIKAAALIAVILTVEMASAQPVSNSPLWFANAIEYVENDKRLIDETHARGQTGLQYLETRDEIARQLSKSPTPSTEELLKLLASSDVRDRRAVLAGTMIAKVNDVLFAQAVLRNYMKEGDYLAKFYSHSLFANFTGDQLKSIEAEFLNALEHERVADALLEGLPNIIRLNRERIRPLLVRYLKSGSPGLRRATVVHVVQLGNDFVVKVKAELEREKATEALILLREVEKSLSPP